MSSLESFQGERWPGLAEGLDIGDAAEGKVTGLAVRFLV